MKTGFLYDERYLQHNTGAGHPERSARLTATMQHLNAQPWFETLATHCRGYAGAALGRNGTCYRLQ